MSKKHGNPVGFPWHIEYLKRKPGDPRRDKRRCVFYILPNGCSKGRECCFGSSHCEDYREMQKKQEEHPQNKDASKPVQKPRWLESIPCSIPMATYIETKDKNMGLLVKRKNKVITLLVKGNEYGYQYPEAFIAGYLKMTPEIEVCIKNDLLKAVWK